MRRPSWSLLMLQVMAIIGERSRKAEPTPVARLVAPGPSVAMHSPGLPVMRPLTSAAKPAEPSCAVSTKFTPPLRIASMRGSTLPLGMPKPRVIPAALSVATIRSALFMGGIPTMRYGVERYAAWRCVIFDYTNHRGNALGPSRAGTKQERLVHATGVAHWRRVDLGC